MKEVLSDLEYISQKLGIDLYLLKDANIFITGGTGFIGKWLLESIIYSNEQLNLNAKITVLTRNSKLFLIEYPHLGLNDYINFLESNIRDFTFPDNHFNYIIHAATDADAKLNADNPLLMLDTITEGTRRVLEFARLQKNLKAFLLTSSGAVYGKQPEQITHIKESEGFPLDINNPNSAYAEGKRLAELYCSIYSKQYNIPVKIARCFAFVGPYLPLDKHFAIGNFISDVLKNQDIVIKGDGTPLRSYMYASDLIIWLLTILIKGDINSPYNVGSDKAISILELANEVNKFQSCEKKVKVLGLKKDKPIEQYVPDIQKTKTKFNFGEGISLRESIYKSIKFNKTKDTDESS